MKCRTAALLAVVLLIPVLSSAALEITQGRMRLTLHEDTGRFSLAYLENIKDEQYTELLFSQDPRTSSLGVLLGNRIVTLGSSSDFSQRVEKRSDGAVFIWKNSRFEIRERFSFVRSSAEKLADGLRIDISIGNTSDTAQTVGVNYLFDTYLGERRTEHFLTSTGDALTRETEYVDSVPRWWLSPAPDAHSFPGLRVVTRGSSLTAPERIVFANWKRLSDSTWNMQVREERKFNLLPYSVNDSAVCHFYEPRRLVPGALRKVSFIIGTGKNYLETAARTAGQQESGEVEKLTETAGDSGTREPLRLEERLLRVNDILQAIDSLLESEEVPTGEKVEVLEQKLEELQRRSPDNSQSQ